MPESPLRLMLPDQMSAIRRVHIRIYAMTAEEFSWSCNRFCKLAAHLPSLRYAEILLLACWKREDVHMWIDAGCSDWTEGSTALQSLDSLIWLGDFYEPGEGEICTRLQGRFVLRLGPRHSNPYPRQHGEEGRVVEGFRSLFLNAWRSWQETGLAPTSSETEAGLVERV